MLPYAIIKITIGKVNRPNTATLYMKNRIMKARTSIIPNAVVNSKRLLTGACPDAIHLVIK
jgi:hypothetical protein